jgi:hypothetical protein
LPLMQSLHQLLHEEMDLQSLRLPISQPSSFGLTN